MRPDDTPQLGDIALNPHFRENGEALLRSLLQATDYGILLSGLDRQDILANRRLGELFQCAPDEVVQADPADVRQHARSFVREPERFEEILNETYSDPCCTFEDELALTTDPPRTLRRFTGPVRDRSGQPLGRLWTFLDVTDTKRLQAEVQQQLEARTKDFHATREILHAMNDVCRLASCHVTAAELLAAIAGRLQNLNGFHCNALLLYDNSSLQGVARRRDSPMQAFSMECVGNDSLFDIVARPTSAPRVRFYTLTIRESILPQLLECPLLLVAPLLAEETVIGLLAFRPDDSAGSVPAAGSLLFTQLESLMDQVAQTLETHRLQSDLQDAMQALKSTQGRLVEMEKLHTAGALAASVAHDIRNILSTMQMEIEMLPVPTDTLRDQLNRFSALTHRLLAFSRPNVLETSPAQVDEIIRRIVPLMSGQAQVYSVELRLDLPDCVPPVAADAGQLEHLFVNLCLNAFQAMAERGGTLTIAMRPEASWLVITVSDTGSGIAEEVLPRLFDPFFTTRATGFGLGLFSCKRIAEEHGGQIQAVSLPGKGACFTVYLPIMAVD